MTTLWLTVRAGDPRGDASTRAEDGGSGGGGPSGRGGSSSEGATSALPTDLLIARPSLLLWPRHSPSPAGFSFSADEVASGGPLVPQWAPLSGQGACPGEEQTRAEGQLSHRRDRTCSGWLSGTEIGSPRKSSLIIRIAQSPAAGWGAQLKAAERLPPGCRLQDGAGA